MSHEYRILERMLIKGQISRQEFKERHISEILQNNMKNKRYLTKKHSA